ncbi:CobW/HypB/UreG, nucleotide-binding domain [Caldanaerobius fijiensis DSM 17918]|uniref:CobW/HypB/UreG, nucleotide-binding domain n=1 Tax=Caldanaerobius fijiensis DSM 17918 TaxID=1121256 RepID=A0A1M5F7U6_9THEO|nr:GTP-binding protein [Caldanaerobius fijiensis]SHF87182.1 CobW/HypB/UreG, nucleotide-binding domain [Caldanaerobius fijiensis DSM 17918]
MSAIKLIIVGGFLGAGKTTCILSMAKKLISKGKKVDIVTNDQGSQLVDTNFLRSAGLSVLEVTGGCFCCKFDEFVDRINNLADSEMPDIILAEPVGSCTDLVATIFRPFKLNFASEIKLSPLCVVVDPRRAKKFMLSGGDVEFPDEINYLFKKQLEEADIILLNKIDMLTQQEVKSISDFLKENFKGSTVMPISAKEETGIDECMSVILGSVATDRVSMDLDYDIYAKAEEYLGWLNSSVILRGSDYLDFNQFIVDLLKSIKESMGAQKSGIAHLKVYAVSDEDYAKASITGVDEDIDFSQYMKNRAKNVSLIVNARINIDPDKLASHVDRVLKDTCSKWGIKMDGIKTESFKPKKPEPKYRIK